jgi:hypothetical protein
MHGWMNWKDLKASDSGLVVVLSRDWPAEPEGNHDKSVKIASVSSEIPFKNLPITILERYLETSQFGPGAVNVVIEMWADTSCLLLGIVVDDNDDDYVDQNNSNKSCKFSGSYRSFRLIGLNNF